MLAVCRGMQVLNSALGGTLHQHLPDRTGHDGHRPEPGTFGGYTGSSSPRTAGSPRMLGDTRRRSAATTTRRWTYRRTGADRGRPADDGTVEAVECPSTDFVLGVQWHPEQDPDDDRLVARAGRRGDQEGSAR